MTAYYNEHDPFAAAWLRNLIAGGHIAPGDVDERDIRDVRPDDLRDYAQCHFFAGIGGWSYALRLAGWPDDEPVWTGSCPCQPFSSAGRRGGTSDERHLWPHWFHLINVCRPPIVFGEQVASKDGLAWLDLVSADLEGAAYAVGAADLCAAGVGAPHIRQRLWFVADADGGRASAERKQRGGQQRQQPKDGRLVLVADTERDGRIIRCRTGGLDRAQAADGSLLVDAASKQVGLPGRARLTGGPYPWSPADWLPCRDGKARPVEPIAQQMVDGLSRAMGRLRSDPEAQRKVIHAATAAGLAEQTLRTLRGGDDPSAVWQALGRCVGFPEATLLLAGVCQQSRQLGDIFNSAAPGGEQEHQALLRALRCEPAPAACAPQGREHPQQLAGQLGDALPELSQAGSSLRGHLDALRQFTGLPLAHGVPGRVGKLRAYGNAIVPQVAAEFIAAAAEIIFEREMKQCR